MGGVLFVGTGEGKGMTLYNLRTDGDQYRITKFTNDLEVESSYLCSASECTCPAGSRPSCRHRQMLSPMIAHYLTNSPDFYDFESGQIIVQHYEEPEGLDEDPEVIPDGVERDNALSMTDMMISPEAIEEEMLASAVLSGMEVKTVGDVTVFSEQRTMEIDPKPHPSLPPIRRRI